MDKTSKVVYGVLLLALFVSLLFIVVFLLAPLMGEVISLSNEYDFDPEPWTYYAILGCCLIALITCLFILFHQYLIRGGNGDRYESF